MPIHYRRTAMSEEKAGSCKGLTEARKRANKKYNDRFVEIKKPLDVWIHFHI